MEWLNEGMTICEIGGLRFEMTCAACPEQYDVYDSSGREVGYIRLRHSNFTVDYPFCGAKTVYQEYVRDDGMFYDDETRFTYLKRASVAINSAISADEYC